MDGTNKGFAAWLPTVGQKEASDVDGSVKDVIGQAMDKVARLAQEREAIGQRLMQEREKHERDTAELRRALGYCHAFALKHKRSKEGKRLAAELEKLIRAHDRKILSGRTLDVG